MTHVGSAPTVTIWRGCRVVGEIRATERIDFDPWAKVLVVDGQVVVESPWSGTSDLWPTGSPRDEVDRREMEFPCDYCGAATGEWCSNSRGARAACLHTNRWKQASRAGRLPL